MVLRPQKPKRQKVNKNDHIIVLNGRHYNAKTGEALSHPTEPAPRPATAGHAHVQASPPRAVAVKPVRHAAHHVTAHSPKPPRTLMRQAVKKPSGSLKRRIKVQGRLEGTYKQPSTKTSRATLKSAAGTHARKHAIKGPFISHFSPNLFATVAHATAVASSPVPATAPVPRPTMKPAFAAAVPKKPRTTAELLDYAIQYANSPTEPDEPAHRKHHRKVFKRRAHAAAHS